MKAEAAPRGPIAGVSVLSGALPGVWGPSLAPAVSCNSARPASLSAGSCRPLRYLWMHFLVSHETTLSSCPPAADEALAVHQMPHRYDGRVLMAEYYNVCYACPTSSLPCVQQKVLQRSETRAQTGACVADIVILVIRPQAWHSCWLWLECTTEP